MPARLGGVLFDEIPAEDVVGAVMSRIEPFVRKILTEPGNRAFTKHNNPETVQKWDWVAQGMGESATRASALYSTLDPIMFYNASEAGSPFRRGATLWEMCSGLVGQVRRISLARLRLFEPARDGRGVRGDVQQQGHPLARLRVDQLECERKHVRHPTRVCVCVCGAWAVSSPLWLFFWALDCLCLSFMLCRASSAAFAFLVDGGFLLFCR